MTTIYITISILLGIITMMMALKHEFDNSVDKQLPTECVIEGLLLGGLIGLVWPILLLMLIVGYTLHGIGYIITYFINKLFSMLTTKP